jgi:hypothetical protein
MREEQPWTAFVLHRITICTQLRPAATKRLSVDGLWGIAENDAAVDSFLDGLPD